MLIQLINSLFILLGLVVLPLVDAQETDVGNANNATKWHLELKNGTIFSVNQFPISAEDSFLLKINGKNIKIPEREVVSLTSTKPLLEQFIYLESDNAKAEVSQNKQTVVRVESKLHRGSGTIISPKGYVLTNSQLFKNSHEIIVTLSSGKKYQAELIAKAERFDLAVVKIQYEGEDKILFPYAFFGDERNLEDGARVYTFSTSDKQNWEKFTTVLPSHKESFGTEDNIYYQQCHIAMRSDNTGSPLFDESGKLVGIITRNAKSVQAEKIWFSTSVSFIKTILKNINAYITNPSNKPVRYNLIDGR